MLNKFLKRQADAAKRTGYGAIWLRREGDYVIVEVTRNGHWYEVIREHHDGAFSHCVEPLGIEAMLPGGEEYKVTEHTMKHSAESQELLINAMRPDDAKYPDWNRLMFDSGMTRAERQHDPTPQRPDKP